MKATLLVLPRVEQDMVGLHPIDFRRIVETMEFLCDFPHAAQTAGLDELPDIRRAIAGQYLIYYRFDANRNAVIVFTVRHGRRELVDTGDLKEESVEEPYADY